MNKYTLLFASLLPLVSLSGCNFASSIDTETRTEVTITDSQGTRVMKSNPSRVAIFSFDVLDILDTVGVDQAGIDQLAMPKANMPAMYKPTYDTDDYANVGTLFEPNYDELDIFDPELIILSNRSITQFAALQEAYPDADILDASLPNYALNEGLSANVSNLSLLFPGVAEELNANLEAIQLSFTQIAELTSDVEAMFLLVNANAISFYGPLGRYAMLHNELGFAAADPDTSEGGSHGKSVSFEYVVGVNPEVLFLMDRGAAVGNEATLDDVAGNVLLQNIQAKQNDHIYALDPIAWYITTGGFQSSRQMIIDINQYLDDIGDPINVPTFE